MQSKPRVVVLGGGFAGLETAFYIRYKLGSRVALTLVSDRGHFLFKPNTIYIPFGEDPDQYLIDLKKPCERKDIEFILGTADTIDRFSRRVALKENRELSYDYLVIATGAAMRPGEIPGLAEHALTIWTPQQMLELRAGLEATVAAAKRGEQRRLLFLVPPNNKCAGPLYELVLMTDTWLRHQGVRDQVRLTFATVEESYIQAFGPRLNTVVVEEFTERDIEGHTGYAVVRVDSGVVRFQNQEELPYDLLIAFPPYVAAHSYAGLPSDARGFIKVEPNSRRVVGMEDIYAVGDAANFPIKQAYLALLQGDAAGDHIAAAIEGRSPEVLFEPMSMCVMEEMNKATFAQVPLRYTSDPEKPIAVATDDVEHYKVGVSPLWRLGKKVLGFYLPWRFSHGEPFHAGFAWNVMDLGLKVMSKILAT